MMIDMIDDKCFIFYSNTTTRGVRLARLVLISTLSLCQQQHWVAKNSTMYGIAWIHCLYLIVLYQVTYCSEISNMDKEQARLIDRDQLSKNWTRQGRRCQ